MVRCAAGFNDNEFNGSIVKPARKLRSRLTVRFHHAPGVIGHSELKHRLCQINGNGNSIHFGLLSFEQLIPTTMLISAPRFDAKERAESIPSFKQTRLLRSA